jgi:CRP-like cAMP-binding protein
MLSVATPTLQPWEDAHGSPHPLPRRALTADGFDQLRSFIEARVSLSAADWAKVRDCFVPRRLARKEFYLRPGDNCSTVAFLARGCLNAYYEDDRAEMTMHIFFDDSLVADYSSFLTGARSDQAIRAIEDCDLVVAERAAISALYQSVSVWERFGRLIAEDVYRCAHRRTMSFLIESPQERYLSLVSSRADVVHRVPQYVIASYLGITPEALSRIKRRTSPRGEARA